MEGDFILCQATVVFARWRLDDTDAVRHVKGIVVLREPHVGLLLAIRADEGVDLLALDLVHGLHRVQPDAEPPPPVHVLLRRVRRWQRLGA